MIDIFTRIHMLKLPIGYYVVTGGSMEAHGLRTARDIDIVVDDALFSELEKSGWPHCNCETCFTNGRHLIKDGVEIVTEYCFKNKYRANTPELIRTADVIQGLPFVRLTELLKWKQAANREKDQADIKSIKEYLVRQKG